MDSHPSMPRSDSPPTPWIFVTTYKKSPSCSLFRRNAGGSVNSRRRVAPPRGPGDSRSVQRLGLPRAQPDSAKGQEGSVWDRKEKTKKGEKKGRWELKKAQTCQNPSLVLRPNLQNVQNQPKLNVWYLWKGLPKAGNHLPRGLCWDSPGAGWSLAKAT